jgi:hypothetical protein
MRDNSGSGKSKNNNHDPTLEEHRGQGGPGARGGDFTEGAPFDIAGNARVRGEDPSPDDRARGETSSKEPAPPVDTGGS